jgi:hypothetical protein
MWDCEHCGCRAIAAGIEACPHCQKPRTASADTPPAGGKTPAEKPGEKEESVPPPPAGEGTSPQASAKAAKAAGKDAW